MEVTAGATWQRLWQGGVTPGGRFPYSVGAAERLLRTIRRGSWIDQFPPARPNLPMTLASYLEAEAEVGVMA